MTQKRKTIVELVEKTGWRVFPVVRNTKIPHFEGWQELASSDPSQIEKWSRRYPGCNFGITTGETSGVNVVDIDIKGGRRGYENFEALLAEHGHTLCDVTTTSVKTPSGGLHLYFRHDPTLDLKNDNSGSIATHVDFKTTGGYVIAPGSYVVDAEEGHEGSYELVGEVNLKHLRILPDFLSQLLLRKNKPQALKPVTKIPEGQRNDRLFRELSSARAKGYSDDALRGVAQARNLDCEIPLATRELDTLVKSVSNYKPGGARFDLTDLGNAKRLVHYHGEDLKYCYGWKAWLVWNGQRWVRDETGEVYRRAKDIVDRILLEALTEEQGDRKKDLSDWAKRTQNKDRIKAMVELAASEEGIPVMPGQLDQDSMLLNVQNGTIDLKSGQLRAHDRADLLTKMAPVTHDVGAKCPVWEKFLSQIMGEDEDKTTFLQMIVGYGLTGSISEQKMFFCFGEGANGKSTFLELIRELLGDYAMQAPTQTFMAKRGDGVPNDIARLKGARFVTAVENEEGKKLAEALIKQLTGGDVITARFMRAEFFEFKPQFKIVMAGNHKPQVRGTDKGIWRRLCLLPFDVTIPEDQQDKDLPAKLRCELSGVLNWAIHGCQEWQKNGLDVPEVIKVATSTFKKEMDDFGAFLENECIEGASENVFASELLEEYRRWSGDRGYSHIQLRNRLTERGYSSVRHGAGVMWKGLRLRVMKIQ